MKKFKINFELFNWFAFAINGKSLGKIVIAFNMLTIHIWPAQVFMFNRWSRCWGFRKTDVGYDCLESIDFGLGPFLLITYLR